MDVRSLLKVMVDQEASDLYLTVDSAPAYRVHGSTQQTDAPPFTNEQLEALAQPMLKNGYGQYLQGLLKDKVY